MYFISPFALAVYQLICVFYLPNLIYKSLQYHIQGITILHSSITISYLRTVFAM